MYKTPGSSCTRLLLCNVKISFLLQSQLKILKKALSWVGPEICFQENKISSFLLIKKKKNQNLEFLAILNVSSIYALICIPVVSNRYFKKTPAMLLTFPFRELIHML